MQSYVFTIIYFTSNCIFVQIPSIWINIIETNKLLKLYFWRRKINKNSVSIKNNEDLSKVIEVVKKDIYKYTGE